MGKFLLTLQWHLFIFVNKCAMCVLNFISSFFSKWGQERKAETPGDGLLLNLVRSQKCWSIRRMCLPFLAVLCTKYPKFSSLRAIQIANYSLNCGFAVDPTPNLPEKTGKIRFLSWEEIRYFGQNIYPILFEWLRTHF